eukprot:Rhum_TRINITY_DN6255_c0_g2::Rhum_TRINITY_DN6255_c0_g2_i1::g.19496::m.19496
MLEEVRIAHPASDAQVALLKAFHAVAEDCIPAEELEPFEEWVGMLEADTAAGPLPAFRAVVLCSDGDVVGGVAYERYPRSGVRLLTYLAVHEAHRGKGHGRRLCEACLSDGGGGGGEGSVVLLEAHRPGTPDAVMSPHTRLAIYEKLGFRALPGLRYVAPAIAPGTPNVGGLMLLAKVGAAAVEALPAALPAGVLEVFLPEYWDACYADDVAPLAGMLRDCEEREAVRMVRPSEVTE